MAGASPDERAHDYGEEGEQKQQQGDGEEMLGEANEGYRFAPARPGSPVAFGVSIAETPAAGPSTWALLSPPAALSTEDAGTSAEGAGSVYATARQALPEAEMAPAATTTTTTAAIPNTNTSGETQPVVEYESLASALESSVAAGGGSGAVAQAEEVGVAGAPHSNNGDSALAAAATMLPLPPPCARCEDVQQLQQQHQLSAGTALAAQSHHHPQPVAGLQPQHSNNAGGERQQHPSVWVGGDDSDAAVGGSSSGVVCTSTSRVNPSATPSCGTTPATAPTTTTTVGSRYVVSHVDEEAESDPLHRSLSSGAITATSVTPTTTQAGAGGIAPTATPARVAHGGHGHHPTPTSITVSPATPPPSSPLVTPVRDSAYATPLQRAQASGPAELGHDQGAPLLLRGCESASLSPEAALIKCVPTPVSPGGPPATTAATVVAGADGAPPLLGLPSDSPPGTSTPRVPITRSLSEVILPRPQSPPLCM